MYSLTIECFFWTGGKICKETTSVKFWNVLVNIQISRPGWKVLLSYLVCWINLWIEYALSFVMLSQTFIQVKANELGFRLF
jgi:hypothetical protein